MTDSPVRVPEGSQDLKQFQLAATPLAEKSKKEWGKRLAQKINDTLSAGSGSYYFTRNNRYRLNRDWVAGLTDIRQKFQDRLDMNGKQNYLNLSWSCMKLPNRIVSGLVGRWMGRSEKVQVTAKDPLSLRDKQEQYEELEYLLYDRRQQEALQAESGVQLLPQDGFIPADQEELNLWVTGFQRLPEEILMEMGSNDVLEANGFFDANKEKCLHNSAQCGFVGTYTELNESGVITVEPVAPENAIYSASHYDDFRDTTYRGRVKERKAHEIRRRYGSEFGGHLSEKELFELFSTACEYNAYDKIAWDNAFSGAVERPYDEWNIDTIEFEWKSVDSEPYTVSRTKKHQSTLIRKGRPERPAGNEEVVEDTRINIYRGVFVRGSEELLEWGLKTNMIRPNDPKESGNAEFSYSFYMPQAYKGLNLAIPQKIEEPIEQMILLCLRMEQLVASMTPPGAAVNVDAMQELDLGLGGMTSTIEAKKIHQQTGTLYYRGRDAEGNPLPVPIQELTNSGFLPQMQALIQLYQFHYGRLRDELGEDPALMSQALQPRVTQGNVETAVSAAEAATDYFYTAYTRCLADTAKKVSCLLQKSVAYGARAYRAILQQEDVAGREFSTAIRLLPTGEELLKFEGFVNGMIQGQPDLVLFIDPFQLLRIAREDVKLAERLFRQGQKKMLLHQQQTAAQNQQQTIEGQIASAQAAEKSKQETAQLEGSLDMQKTKLTAETQLKNTLLTSYLKMLETGVGIPAGHQPLLDALLQNVAIPALAENEAARQQIQAQMIEQAAQQTQPGVAVPQEAETEPTNQ